MFKYYLPIIFLVFIFSSTQMSLLADGNVNGYLDCPCPLILAHQGASNHLPANTIDAFQKALDNGADIIELGIWRSRDNVWVVVHDKNLKNITGVDRNVNELTFEEILSLDAGFNFQDHYGSYLYRNKDYRIPSLESVFKHFNEYRINIEIKEKSITGLSSLIELINGYKMDKRVLVVSRTYRVINHFRSLSNNKIFTGASYIDALITKLFAHRVGYDLPYTAAQLPFYSPLVRYLGYVDQEWIESIQSKGQFVHFWTVDDPDDIQEAIILGADGIISNEPGRVYKILGSMGMR